MYGIARIGQCLMYGIARICFRWYICNISVISKPPRAQRILEALNAIKLVCCP